MRETGARARGGGSEAARSLWPLAAGAALLSLAVVACRVQPDEPATPAGSGVGGHVYNPPTPGVPEQIDNDAGQLIGSRPAASHDGGGVAPPRSEGDAAFPESDSGAPILVFDSGRAPDSGVVGVTDASPDASPNPDGALNPDAPGDAAPVDSGPATTPDAGPVPTDLCPTSLGAGDLAIVEAMLVSQQGTGDMGQWLEVQSTRACSLNLNGLHAAANGPTSPYTLEIAQDVYLPADGIFVIANSLDPSLNNDLPGPLVFGWDGSPADVLHSAGGTVTLAVGSTVIDNFVYPQFGQLYVGVSVSFPADCPWSDRSDWERWSFSTNDWYEAFLGTPNAPNTDVTCF